MMTEVPALPDPLVVVVDAQPMADSRIVAQMFYKRHADVLRMIRDLLRLKPELERNFAFELDRVATGNGGARKSPFYHCDESGFMVLVMGFTGEAALTIKLRFIEQFRAMRDRLNTPRMRDWELRERESARRATVGAKALCVRKREKPILESERRGLLAAVQIPLPITHPQIEDVQPEQRAARESER
ncbi:Rha family transcriptional regulator [Paraburkholderia sp. EG304]|uniref:Rha family transcriptional regulator n=1 Tax=Paraburkholderia sp. EG304 TaxID=3237015 RepID=UPI003978F950